MSFTIVSMPAMMVMGVELRTTFMNNECYTATPAFWEQQRSHNTFAKIPNKVTPFVLIGLYTNYTPDFSLVSGYYSLIVGSPVTSVDTISNGMVVKEVPAARYAVFTARGPFATAIGKAWMDVWQNKDIKRTFINDFEWYDAQSTDDENSIVRIYIGVE